MKEKLVRSGTETQSLKEELESAKVNLKEISKQIHNLQISNVPSFTVENDNVSDHKVEAIETAEMGCQVGIESEGQCEETPKIDLLNRSSQTVDSSTREEANQTSFIEESDDYEVILKELSKLMVKSDDVKKQYDEKCLNLNSLQADFGNHRSKCKTEHEEKLSNLQMELSSAEEMNYFKSQCLDVQAAKITQLEHSFRGVTELQEKISELSKHLETCQAKKEHLHKVLDENNDRLLDFEDRLEHSAEKEREKDAEVISLQKEMKQMVSTTGSDYKSGKLMEEELENTIKDLTTANEMISRKEEYIEELELHVKHSQQNTKILEHSAQERQAENVRLKSMNEELKSNLTGKEREMEALTKNRDEMVTKYESLVKTQQEQLEKQKRALTKPHSKERDHCGNTSEVQLVLKERQIRRPPKKFTPSSPKQSEVSVNKLSGSESRRSEKCTKLPPPEQISERRRITHKKKLYMENDSFQDIEPLETTVSITSSAKLRNLRSRRK